MSNNLTTASICRYQALQMRRLRQELQEILGTEGAQIPAHWHKAVRVRLLQAAFQRQDKARESHLHAHRRETVQMRHLRTSIRREISAEGAQMHGVVRQSVEAKCHSNFILPAEAVEKSDKSKLKWTVTALSQRDVRKFRQISIPSR